ncbi:MAG: GTP pyrophosphokinase [Candidatus Dormiibacterota bacterium]
MSAATNLLERALRIALDAHEGQRYPSPEGEPYILHPLRVMASVAGESAQIAAVLHDVIEDTEITLAQLARWGFSPSVLFTLDCLTRRRGEAYSVHIGRVATDPTAVQVKIADLKDNLRNNLRLARSPDVKARIQRYEQALASLNPQGFANRRGSEPPVRPSPGRRPRSARVGAREAGS